MARRSRKGAWIEIPSVKDASLEIASRSRKGAWIEIPSGNSNANGRTVSLP